MIKISKLTVDIGIPAYNEEGNIENLLRAIIAQKRNKFLLKNIIVVSDKSSDSTDKLVRKFKSQVTLYRNRKRMGQALTQNKITKKATSDILILLNADILIKDTKFIEKIIFKFSDDKVGLVCPRVLPYENESINFFERVINTSVSYKNGLFENWGNGKNIYTCRGTARALRKDLYKKLKWPQGIVAEDAYSYLFAITEGYKYSYQPKATIYYRSPNSFQDHQRQSIRFKGNFREMSKIFPQDLVNKELKIPFWRLVKSVKYVPIKDFLFFIFFMKVNLLTKLVKATRPSARWRPSLSTKSFNTF